MPVFPRTTSSRPFLFQSLLSPSPRVRLSVPSHPSGPCGVLRDLGDGQGLWEKVSAKFGPMCRERRGQARSARGQARAEMEGGHCWEPVHGERSTEPEVAPHATGLKRTSCKTGVWERPKPCQNRCLMRLVGKHSWYIPWKVEPHPAVFCGQTGNKHGLPRGAHGIHFQLGLDSWLIS